MFYWENTMPGTLLAFLGLGTTELLILAGVLLLLFGSAKLPSLMRSMGRSVNEFKTGLNEKPTDSQKLDDKRNEAESSDTHQSTA